MTLNCIIADDEKGSRDILVKYLARYCTEVSVKGEAENVEQAFKLITETAPDLVFLDISMPGGNGFELYEKFDQVNFEVIFVTAYEQYALKAIKNNAADYLLKPISITELKEAVARAADRIKTKRAASRVAQAPNPVAAEILNEKISVPVKDGFMYVNVADIVRCEADSGYTWLHFKNKEKFLVTRTLKEFEELFARHMFVRVHHQHLINLKHVTKYQNGQRGGVALIAGTQVQVSQRKRAEFLEKLGIKA